ARVPARERRARAPQARANRERQGGGARWGGPPPRPQAGGPAEWLPVVSGVIYPDRGRRRAGGRGRTGGGPRRDSRRRAAFPVAANGRERPGSVVRAELHRRRRDTPDLARVLGDGAVARELARVGDVLDHHAQPVLLVEVGAGRAVVAGDVVVEVGA